MCFFPWAKGLNQIYTFKPLATLKQNKTEKNCYDSGLQILFTLFILQCFDKPTTVLSSSEFKQTFTKSFMNTSCNVSDQLHLYFVFKQNAQTQDGSCQPQLERQAARAVLPICEKPNKITRQNVWQKKCLHPWKVGLILFFVFLENNVIVSKLSLLCNPV